MKSRHLLLPLSLALAAMLGYWLAKTAVPQKVTKIKPHSETAQQAGPIDEPPTQFNRGERETTQDGDHEAEAEGALAGQRVLAFKDRAALEDFIKRAGSKIRILGQLDALNALQIGFSNYGDLLALLDGSEEQSFIFPVQIPDIKQGSVQEGAVPLGNNLLKWLGISGDNSSWGKGVRIAILDTGVTANSAFNTNIQMINLVPLPADLSKQNGHGTAVAGMIIGNNSLTPGVAPHADILSIRIADDNGISNNYLLAQGIIAAVDAGASLINISMGSFDDSAIVRSAIAYANAKGAMIFAAAGNNGTNDVSFPAANAGVIAVSAVDAVNNHLDFSNTGPTVDISAPGYGVNAAWSDNQAVSATGTSFSTPIVVGTMAGILSLSGNENLSPQQAWALLIEYANDGDTSGPDEKLGAGMPDPGRVINGDTPGIYDAALASSRILPPDSQYPNGQVEFLIQNCGTETIINSTVNVDMGGGTIPYNITTLAPKAVTTVRVPISRSLANQGTTMRVDAQVSLSNGVVDAKPSNDRRVENYASSPVR